MDPPFLCYRETTDKGGNAMTSIYPISLDLHKTSAPISLSVKQGDTGREIHISLTDGSTPYKIPDGSYAVFAGTKPDNKVLWNSRTIKGNTIIYEMTEQTVVVVGWIPVQIRLYSAGGKLLTSPDFVLIVDEPAVADGTVVAVSDNEITALTQLVTECTALKADLEEFKTGGYYTPVVTQPDENTLQIDFTPSSEDMPAVGPAKVTLPGGSGNDSTQNAVLSETEKTLILRLFNKAAYNNAGMLDTYNELATLWSGSTEEPGGSEGGGDSGGDGETTIPATGIVLSADTLTFDSITSQLLIATVTPVNTTDKVVWTSSDQSVATVSGGAVKSVGDGSCAITATAGPVSASCNVTVALPAVDGYENGYLNDSGVLTGSKTDFVSTAYKDVTPGDTIIVAVGGADIATVRTIRINEYDANKNFVKRQYELTNSYKEFTLDATTEFVRVGFGVNVTDTESLDSLFANYSLFRSSEVSQRAIDLTAEIGNLSITDGIETDGNDRLRTDFVEGVSFVVYSSPVTLSRSAARKYDSNKALTTAAADTKYVRILLVAEAEDSPNDIFGTILFINGNFYRVVEG